MIISDTSDWAPDHSRQPLYSLFKCSSWKCNTDMLTYDFVCQYAVVIRLLLENCLISRTLVTDIKQILLFFFIITLNPPFISPQTFFPPSFNHSVLYCLSLLHERSLLHYALSISSHLTSSSLPAVFLHSFLLPTFHLCLQGYFLSDIDWIYSLPAVKLWQWVIASAVNLLPPRPPAVIWIYAPVLNHLDFFSLIALKWLVLEFTCGL